MISVSIFFGAVQRWSRCEGFVNTVEKKVKLVLIFCNAPSIARRGNPTPRHLLVDIVQSMSGSPGTSQQGAEALPASTSTAEGYSDLRRYTFRRPYTFMFTDSNAIRPQERHSEIFKYVVQLPLDISTSPWTMEDQSNPILQHASCCSSSLPSFRNCGDRMVEPMHLVDATHSYAVDSM
jgi:hypothetical protein